MHTRPVWAEVSSGNLVRNYLELRRTLEAHLESIDSRTPASLLAVVKADAYGHGLNNCASPLVAAGAAWLGVTSVEEAVAARAICPAAHLLVMSGIWQGDADAVLDYGLTPLVWESFHLDLLEAAAMRRGLPAQSVAVHLELDTGMSRQGSPLFDRALDTLLMRFRKESPLRLEGLATHFSAPEDLESEETARQLALLEGQLQVLRDKGISPAWLHAGNSASLLDEKQIRRLLTAASEIGAQLMLRPGLALYGYWPKLRGIDSAARSPLSVTLYPVLQWKSRLTSLRTIQPGQPVGYNSTFRASREMRLALLPVGYADGFRRSLSNRGHVLVRGRHAQIVGRISMDQTVLDITGIPEVQIGDEAVLLGSQGDETLSAYDLADLDATIPYEVLCGIAARVPRVVVD